MKVKKLSDLKGKALSPEKGKNVRGGAGATEYIILLIIIA